MLFGDPNSTECRLDSKLFKFLLEDLKGIQGVQGAVSNNYREYCAGLSKYNCMAAESYRIRKDANGNYQPMTISLPGDAVPTGGWKNYSEDNINRWESQGYIIRNKYYGYKYND
jgi:hypothetical protein